MSDKLKINLQRWSLIAVVIGGLWGVCYGFLLLPYRVDAVDKQIEVLKREVEIIKTKHEKDAETLARIDERTKDILERLRK